MDCKEVQGNRGLGFWGAGFGIWGLGFYVYEYVQHEQAGRMCIHTCIQLNLFLRCSQTKNFEDDSVAKAVAGAMLELHALRLHVPI